MSRALSRPQILVIIAGAIVLAISLGVRQTFGLFLVPMTLDLEWSRGLFGLAMAVQNLLWAPPNRSSAASLTAMGRAR